MVVVTPFGDASADDLIANGVADAAISRPLLRSEIEELLRRIAVGKNALHSPTVAGSVRRGHCHVRKSQACWSRTTARSIARSRSRRFTRLGAHVDTVENGVEAVSAAARRAHDIILMDGSMPEMDGFTAARIIRQAEQSEDREPVPIVALTAHVIGAAADEWRRAGMDGVIHKPFTIAQLAQCLAEIVPQFQTGVAEPVASGDSACVAEQAGATERSAAADMSDATVGSEVPLIDPATLAQLRTLDGGEAG